MVSSDIPLYPQISVWLHYHQGSIFLQQMSASTEIHKWDNVPKMRDLATLIPK